MEQAALAMGQELHLKTTYLYSDGCSLSVICAWTDGGAMATATERKKEGEVLSSNKTKGLQGIQEIRISLTE